MGQPLRTGRSVPINSATEWVEARSRGIAPRGSVLLHAPSFAFQAPGGGENQLIQTGRELESLEVPIRLFSPWIDRLDHARLLHLFGMSREGLELARVANRRGVPVVMSPICWFEPRAIWALEPGVRKKIGGLGRWGLRRAVPRIGGWRRELLMLSDAILPNSRAEGEQLIKLFAVPAEKIHFVPNGVSAHFGQADPELFRSKYGDQEFILFVGRVEPRKNPLGLIRAAQRLGLHTVIIGDAPPAADDYAAECRREGGREVTWLRGIDHHAPLLASAYAAATVFALPSWFETPGLAALEAALAGCPVVITPYGSAREYFGDLATYARPHRREEIAQALQTSWQQGRNSRLSGFVASRYLWPVVAQRTAEIYDQITG
jgi:glycosyltransferase involved in cell wall biosynthesis